MTLNSCPPLVFFSLTPEELPDEDDSYFGQQDATAWLEDSECQENLSHILSLTPEETRIDKDNHIQTRFNFFFEELGYFTEEPEPIDPSRDYESEAKELFSQRDKKARQKHIELLPSLDYSNSTTTNATHSGVSSLSSSIHHESCLLIADIRSPHYMGDYKSTSKNNAYNYGHYHHHPHHILLDCSTNKNHYTTTTTMNRLMNNRLH